METKNTPGLLAMKDMIREGMVTRKALRFYEQQGMLLPAARNKHGQRLYTRSDLLRLKLIRSLRDAGLSIAAICEVLDSRARHAEDRTPITWLARMESTLAYHSHELQEQLRLAQEGERALRDAVEWLHSNRKTVLQTPASVVMDDAVPLIIRALLSQPSALLTYNKKKDKAARPLDEDAEHLSRPAW